MRILVDELPDSCSVCPFNSVDYDSEYCTLNRLYIDDSPMWQEENCRLVKLEGIVLGIRGSSRL